jgi:predicted nucleic acid-binding protein
VTTFIDTSFLVALVLKDDALHRRAAAWDASITGSCLTTEFVLFEFANYLSVSRLKALAWKTIDQLRQDPFIEIVSSDQGWVEEGYQLFRSHSDKDWSLTDCTSFLVMKQRGIVDALTHDHHFEQAGFRALLRGEPTSN